MKTQNTTIEVTSVKFHPETNRSAFITAEVNDTTGARDGFIEHELYHAPDATATERNAEIDAFVAKLNE